jgi:hypothetical protein
VRPDDKVDGAARHFRQHVTPARRSQAARERGDAKS